MRSQISVSYVCMLPRGSMRKTKKGITAESLELSPSPMQASVISMYSREGI